MSLKLDLLNQSVGKITFPKRSRRVLRKVGKIFLYLFIIILLFVTSLSYKIIFSGDGVLKNISHLPFIAELSHLITGSSKKIAGEREDRINFLLLGQGGVYHEGPYLTDTIILASLKPSMGEIALISIPRDLVVPMKGYGYRKINNANAFGEIDNFKDGGSAFTAQIVSQVFDLKIHYFLRIDFTGFKEIIDKVDGLDIYVEKSFVDSQYPTEDFKTETISFEKGWQHMDGERALKYVRSRHGTSGEASDFARSKRQQKVILALKDKVFSWKTFLIPSHLFNLIDLVQDRIQTNINLEEVSLFLKIAKKIDSEKIIQKVLDDSPQGLLKSNIGEDGAYILLPRVSDYSELQYLAKNIFMLNKAGEEKMKVIIQNGTTIEGLATSKAQELEYLGFEVIKISNAPRQDYEKTVIYDLTQGKKSQALVFLKEKLGANVSKNLPDFLKESLKSSNFYPNNISENENVDFLIVLGSN